LIRILQRLKSCGDVTIFPGLLISSSTPGTFRGNGQGAYCGFRAFSGRMDSHVASGCAI
jgi:hypothetical protein